MRGDCEGMWKLKRELPNRFYCYEIKNCMHQVIMGMMGNDQRKRGQIMVTRLAPWGAHLEPFLFVCLFVLFNSLTKQNFGDDDRVVCVDRHYKVQHLINCNDASRLLFPLHL